MNQHAAALYTDQPTTAQYSCCYHYYKSDTITLTASGFHPKPLTNSKLTTHVERASYSEKKRFSRKMDHYFHLHALLFT